MLLTQLLDLLRREREKTVSKDSGQFLVKPHGLKQTREMEILTRIVL